MGKKRKNGPTLETMLERPWCYYCERDFDDLTYLIDHQRAKHFRCTNCPRRLNTAGGLSVHLQQVHREPIREIENALPNRGDPNLEIFGMEGIPEEAITAHKQRVTDEFFQSDNGQRAAAAKSQSNGNSAQRPKAGTETKEQMLARLAEHRAKRRKEKELGITDDGSGSQSAQTPTTPEVSAPPQHYAATATSIQPNYQTAAQPGYPPSVYPPGAAYPPAAYPPQPFAAPYTGSPFTPTASYSPFPVPGNAPPFPAQHGSPTEYGVTAAPFAYPGAAGAPSMPPRPAVPYPTRPPNASSASPVSNGPATPNIPGLPQRPNFDSPHLTKEQMAQMHSTTSNGSYNSTKPVSTTHVSSVNGAAAYAASLGDSVDNLIRSVTEGKIAIDGHNPSNEPPRDSAGIAATSVVSPTPVQDSANTPTEFKKEKKGKKTKDDSSSTKLVYSDKDVAPEEKRAMQSRYKPDWDHGNAPNSILGEAGDAVTGAIGDTVRDPQD